MNKICLLCLLLLVSNGLFAQESVESIITKMDDVQRIGEMKQVGSMTSIDRFGERTSDYISWSVEAKKFLIEFTNAEERGQKVLRLEQGLFLYYPDAETVIPIQGAALKQALFGDVSYEDLTNTRSTLEQYSLKLLAEEEKAGQDSWKIEMIAKTNTVPYAKQIIWVSKENYIAYYVEQYSLSDRLLKVQTVEATRKVGDKIVVTRTVIKDALKENSQTIVEIKDVEFSIPKSDKITFSQRDLY